LNTVTRQIVEAFQRVVEGYPSHSREQGLPRLEARVESDFPLTRIPEDHPVILLARKAASNLGRKLMCRTTGGGADANIFFNKGIVTGVIGTGMTDMHSVRESIRLEDMICTAELMIEIIRLHTDGGV
jgi:tripeptide aminopeptidase